MADLRQSVIEQIQPLVAAAEMSASAGDQPLGDVA